jgi:hypothetical protein
MYGQFAVPPAWAVLHSEDRFRVTPADGSHSLYARNVMVRCIFNVNDGLVLSFNIVCIGPDGPRIDVSRILAKSNYGRLNPKALIAPEIYLP